MFKRAFKIHYKSYKLKHEPKTKSSIGGSLKLKVTTIFDRFQLGKAFNFKILLIISAIVSFIYFLFLFSLTWNVQRI